MFAINVFNSSLRVVMSLLTGCNAVCVFFLSKHECDHIRFDNLFYAVVVFSVQLYVNNYVVFYLLLISFFVVQHIANVDQQYVLIFLMCTTKLRHFQIIYIRKYKKTFNIYLYSDLLPSCPAAGL